LFSNILHKLIYTSVKELYRIIFKKIFIQTNINTFILVELHSNIYNIFNDVKYAYCNPKYNVISKTKNGLDNEMIFIQ